MAPLPAQRKIVPKIDFSKYFSSLKTTTYNDYDRPIRGSSSTVHRTLSWNNTGTLLATGATDKIIRIWNAERTSTSAGAGRATPQAELKGHTLEVQKVAFNPIRENELASCSRDGSLRFWDTRTKTQVSKLDIGGDVFSIAWSVDGSAMVVGNKAEVLTTIDMTSGISTPVLQEKHRMKLETNHTTFSMAYPPQDLLVTHGDGTVKILDYPSFEGLHTISSHTSSCSSIAMSPLGNYVAIGGSDAMIALWDTYDWVCKRTMSNANSGKVTGMSWSWDGRYITSSSEDVSSGAGGEGKSEGFEIYHAETGDVVQTVPTRTNAVPAVAWHPKSYVLAYTVVEGGLKPVSSLKIVGDVGAT